MFLLARLPILVPPSPYPRPRITPRGSPGPGIDPTTAFLDDSSAFNSTGAGEGGTDKIHVPDGSSGGGGGAGMSAPSPLPIDAHREEILAHVRNNRVTVIHGETGSGKSSRLPMMLVEDALEHGGGGSGGPRPRMFVSQPRRAAARALAQRVREESERLGMKLGVAMRLGHGVREGPPKAEVTFATTGYIVRLIANNPGLLDSHTHLIIDEVYALPPCLFRVSTRYDYLLLFPPPRNTLVVETVTPLPNIFEPETPWRHFKYLVLESDAYSYTVGPLPYF